MSTAALGFLWSRFPRLKTLCPTRSCFATLTATLLLARPPLTSPLRTFRQNVFLTRHRHLSFVIFVARSLSFCPVFLSRDLKRRKGRRQTPSQSLFRGSSNAIAFFRCFRLFAEAVRTLVEPLSIFLSNHFPCHFASFIRETAGVDKSYKHISRWISER